MKDLGLSTIQILYGTLLREKKRLDLFRGVSETITFCEEKWTMRFSFVSKDKLCR